MAPMPTASWRTFAGRSRSSPRTPSDAWRAVMPRRIVTVKGERWEVSPAGRITQYGKDEFSLRFRRIEPPPAEERVTRYAPRLAKDREASLPHPRHPPPINLLLVSQPSWTPPELGS